MKTEILAWWLLFAGAGLPAPLAAAEKVIMVTPEELKWTDVSAVPPGAKMAVIEGRPDAAGPLTFRIRLPANYRIPAHWHPGIERVTVLSGTFNYGMGDKLDPQKTTALGAGSLVVMPPRMNHFAWTKEETVLQVNTDGPWGVTYVNPADDPRKK